MSSFVRGTHPSMTSPQVGRLCSPVVTAAGAVGRPLTVRRSRPPTSGHLGRHRPRTECRPRPPSATHTTRGRYGVGVLPRRPLSCIAPEASSALPLPQTPRRTDPFLTLYYTQFCAAGARLFSLVVSTASLFFFAFACTLSTFVVLSCTCWWQPFSWSPFLLLLSIGRLCSQVGPCALRWRWRRAFLVLRWAHGSRDVERWGEARTHPHP